MVLSDIPVFREITEDQGIYFPDDDTEAMALAIEKVLSTSNERVRQIENRAFAKLQKKGRIAGKEFVELSGEVRRRRRRLRLDH